jgi:hypothetical protein
MSIFEDTIIAFERVLDSKCFWVNGCDSDDIAKESLRNSYTSTEIKILRR